MAPKPAAAAPKHSGALTHSMILEHYEALGDGCIPKLAELVDELSDEVKPL